jgi:adenylosuccinate lyase
VDTNAARCNSDLTKGATYSELLMVKLVEKEWARHEAPRKIPSLVRSMKPGETLKEAVLRDPELLKLFAERAKEVDEAREPPWLRENPRYQGP